MKNTIYILGLLSCLLLASCSEAFLDEEPVGEISPDQILRPENLEGAILSAYSILNGQMDDASSAFNSPASNWNFGDVVSDDAYKGGGGTGDQNQIHQMELFLTNPTIRDVERKWLALYEGVKRANLAIRLIQQSSEMAPELDQTRLAEMRFLRGHFYFELKKIYNRIPYVDETAETAEDYYVSNTSLSNDELWDKIIADFDQAYDVLPDTQTDAGRPTKMAAKAYLAKVYLFREDWAAAEAAADEVINSGNYELMPNFRDVFLPENDNGPEIIFAVQHAINDGSPNNYNGSIGDRLMAPGGPFYPQYGFLRPTQNLVNAFKTNAAGMPVTDNLDPEEDQRFDPRIDHTLARPGIPYLDLQINYDPSWARDLSTYGPYGPKKRMVSANSPHHLQIWPYVNSLNYYIIRYADLLLWKAEAAIQNGKLEEGREYINRVRERAQLGSKVMNLEGTSEADNYQIQLYSQPFANEEQALEALRTERRLEMAHEGHRFFDLVRWGLADKVLNAYFEVEKTRRPHLSGANFVAGKNEYFPIPQNQIDLGRDLISQNPNYQ
ncbi:RagB/SusD family nutrient uptake outer membrane protein [Cyclobacterium sp.]|uniref:RagB/SusD family nutrient uptake outer membrane protein n=1 Tax=Cyclobacterium sp. TaxID=1966343 RepID=UPI0019AC584D|nr:RagB/SusD family nutrient uptake outer membrane protein [Cyclobacterium sp.]MBD3627460.1 RagB/SusD family nutrient uptake outer membrane protein [Cyclobacterium sp.]